ncbi:MAG: hypothetical protein HFG89_00585 [Dorea sp.]|jgi:hypothetical protein|nr:hypothetical protein [Dorea sp.]
MKKILTLFERKYENHKVTEVLPNITPGMEWVLSGEGVATVKFDGSCCAIIDGDLYKRYDAKKGRKVPEGAIKCQEEADSITGHLPCWVKCDRENPNDKWFWSAFDNYVLEYSKNHLDTCELSSPMSIILDGTYEAVGRHFRNNSYNMDSDILIPHGKQEIEVERSFEGIKRYLSENYIEGIVFWKDGEPKCKIKRSDFGFEWK